MYRTFLLPARFQALPCQSVNTFSQWNTRVVDANAIRLSDPSGILWDKTAQSPWGDASVAKVIGFSGS